MVAASSRLMLFARHAPVPSPLISQLCQPHAMYWSCVQSVKGSLSSAYSSVSAPAAAASSLRKPVRESGARSPSAGSMSSARG